VAPPAVPYADTAHFPRPQVRSFSEMWDMVETTVFAPATRTLNVPRRIDRADGRGREARDLNAWDDVENSSWFEHRNDLTPIAADAMRRGPGAHGPPAPTGLLLIVAPKPSGVTPGFRVQDERGVRYLFKFDPPDAPELASGAEAIATRLVHAVGYYTSEAYVTVFDPARLRIDNSAKVRDADGRERPMTQADVDAVLARAAHLPDGRIRALASWWIPGRRGAFKWTGLRLDDPNDRVPHQHRRELRGFFVISAWMNHVDARRGNTFEQWVGDSAGGYIRHLMQDVSSTLGSGSDRIQTPYDGGETTVDYPHIAGRALSLGLYRAPWERLDTALADSAVGWFSGRGFDPGGWMPLRPNPAFEERTNRDGYWGAKLVASFTDEQLRAAVAAGEYSRPAASDAIVRALIERRDATVRYWFARVTPIEHLVARCEGRDLVVEFEDNGIRHGAARAEDTRYAADLVHGAAAVRRNVVARAGEPLRLADALPPEGFSPGDDHDRVARLTVRAERAGRLAPPATVYLLYEPATHCYRVAGLAH